MTSFMQMRERVRTLFRTHEVGFARAGHGLAMFIGLVAIWQSFPFATGVNRPWIVLALTVLGVFMPLSAEALVLLAFLLPNLFALSSQVAGVTAGLLVVSYLFCGVYQVKKLHYITAFIVARQCSVPSLVPMEAALLGAPNEVVTVICGAVVSFFLQEVHANAGVLMDGEGQMSVVDFLRERIVSNQMFYVYLLAMIAMFLVVMVVRTRNIDHAWMVAVGGGISAEFLIMLSGYLLIGSRHNIPTLIVANIITFLVGAATNYLYRDLDYSRIEKVQFEDDEYYYYVTAVPKIRIAEEKKEVKLINKVSRNRRERRR